MFHVFITSIIPSTPKLDDKKVAADESKFYRLKLRTTKRTLSCVFLNGRPARIISGRSEKAESEKAAAEGSR